MNCAFGATYKGGPFSSGEARQFQDGEVSIGRQHDMESETLETPYETVARALRIQPVKIIAPYFSVFGAVAQYAERNDE